MSLNELKLPNVRVFLTPNHQILKKIINVYHITRLVEGRRGRVNKRHKPRK
jgi:hypothetical protein